MYREYFIFHKENVNRLETFFPETLKDLIVKASPAFLLAIFRL